MMMMLMSQLVQWLLQDAPTAAPAPPGYLPPLVVGRALDVLNDPIDR